MVRAIERSGRSNCSLVLREDGILIGYYEMDDDASSTRVLALDAAAEWEAAAARSFLAVDGDRLQQGPRNSSRCFTSRTN